MLTRNNIHQHTSIYHTHTLQGRSFQNIRRPKLSESRHTLVELCGEKRVSFTWQESMTWVTSSMVMEVSAWVIEMVRVPTLHGKQCNARHRKQSPSNKLTSCLALKPLCLTYFLKIYVPYYLCGTSTPFNPLLPLWRNSKSMHLSNLISLQYILNLSDFWDAPDLDPGNVCGNLNSNKSGSPINWHLT